MKKLVGNTVLFVALVIIDQWTKLVAVNAVLNARGLVVFPDVAGFVLYVGLLFGVGYFGIHVTTRSEQLGVVLLLAGAFGNLIDRIVRGGVKDWIFIPGLTVINLADIMILCGVVILLVGVLRRR